MTERDEMQLYEQWCREGAADAATRKELEGIRGNAAEIRDKLEQIDGTLKVRYLI